MKVVFLQHDSFIKVGTELLSAVLKEKGHECDLFIESGEKYCLDAAIKSRPDLLAFSCTTGSEDWVLKTATQLKKKTDTPIIVGGPHATFFPQIIENPNIDYICRGEGEFALVELLEALGKNRKSIKGIKNIWSKDASGVIYETQVRHFIDDLDQLPFSDFEIYAKYKYMVPYYRDMYPVITGRGCPRNCSYCFNHTYKDLYKNKGKYLRRRSPENVIEELLYAKKVHGVRKLNFLDDAFFTYPQWLREFSELYKRQIALPFIINTEAAQVTEELVRLIKEMGCICVRMGIESGNESLRKEVLQKNVTNRQIREASAYIKKYAMKLSTYNILGIPGESLENALETLLINKEIGADFAQCSILQTYPGTKIDEYVKEAGLLKPSAEGAFAHESFFVSGKVKLKKEKEILNLQKLMQLFLDLHMPLFLIRLMLKVPTNGLFHLIFKCTYAYKKIKINKAKLVPTIKMGLHSLSYMKNK